MGSQWTKFKGGKFVVAYCAHQGDDFIKRIDKFEDAVEITLSDGVTKIRKYDVALEGDIKIELKNWSKWANWSDKAFRNQFIPDIADKAFEFLGQKKYIFKRSKNINSSTLKKNILKALKKADGTPVEELEDLFNKTAFKTRMETIFEAKIDTAADLIKVLAREDKFNKIFEIVE